jgi:hypothetical protein
MQWEFNNTIYGKIKLSLCLTKHHAMKTCGNRGIASSTRS